MARRIRMDDVLRVDGERIFIDNSVELKKRAARDQVIHLTEMINSYNKQIQGMKTIRTRLQDALNSSGG